MGLKIKEEANKVPHLERSFL